MNYTFLVTFIIFISCQSIVAKDYLIVSKANYKLESIDKDVVRDIYLGSKLFWKDGTRIQPVHLPITDDSFNIFLEDVVEMDTNQFLSYWRRKLFSGRAHPPKQFNKIHEIITFVTQNPDSIAVIPEKPKTLPKNLIVIELN